MPSYLITAPDGKKYKVTGNGTKEDALAHFQAQYASQQQPAPQPKQPDVTPEQFQANVQALRQKNASEMSGYDQFMAGAGKSVADVGEG
jgi:hypothetical protein